MTVDSSSARLMVCRLYWGLLCCCLIASSVPGWSQALGPGLAITQFGHTTWRVAEGALTGKPTSITQTKDGYLWIGTDSGLFRFDGTHFSPWTKWPAGVTAQPSIYFLLGARDGTLWIGSATLARIRGGELLELRAAAGRANDFVEDRDGTVWFARTRTKGGPLCRLDQDSYQCYGAKEGIDCITGQSVSVDPEGGIWVGSNSGICDWRHGSSTYHNPTGKQAEAYEMPPVQASLSLGSGGMLVGYSAKGPHFGLQQLLPDGRWKSFDLPGLQGESLATSSLILDSHGDLWIGTNEQGLYHVSGGKADHFGAPDGLSADDINSVYEDHEGSIWVATSAGIDCFRRLKVASFSLKQGFITNRAVAVAAKSDGTVVVGGRGGLQITKGAAVTQLQFGKDLPGHEIRTLMYDHAGTLWAASNNRVGTVVAGRFVPIPLPDVTKNTFRLMIEDQQHQIWIVGTAGLYRIEAGRVVDTHLVHGPHYSIAPDPKTGFWILTHGGSLQRVVEGTSRTLSGEQAKTVEFFGFRVEPNEDIWAWGKRGLRFWTDSGWRTLDSQAGLYCDVVYTTIDDADGNMWIYQPCGISVVPYAELSRWAQQLTKKISPKFMIDPTDGALGDYNDFGPDSARSTDGRLWFTHDSLLQMVDTKHLIFNTIPPPVHIEQIVADHKKFEVKTSVALPARTRDLQVDYTALSFITPQRVRFRYRLSGIDKDWQEVGTRRQAFYMNLAPGQYTFQVIACNSDGVWNEEGATLNFRVESAWYQTIWFRISCVGAFFLLLWAAYRLRVRQLAHQFSMTLEARVGERSRIARELHDTLLQSFHGLLLHLQTASSLLPAKPVQAKQKLDSTIDQAAQAITEGRDAVQELRSSTIETNDLAVAIRAIGEELSADGTAQNIVFQVVVEGAPRSLHPILRDEVYRIAAEALRNAFRHAQARQIEVELRYDEMQFRLRIRDDGIGIDPNVRDGDGHARHYGLRGMRERAKLAGGKMTVWSEVDSGTEIELSIPAALAYATSLRRSWLSEKFFRKRTDGTRTDSKETDVKVTRPNS